MYKYKQGDPRNEKNNIESSRQTGVWKIDSSFWLHINIQVVVRGKKQTLI